VPSVSTTRINQRVGRGTGTRCTVKIDGVEVVVRDTEWVVFDKDKYPIGTMYNDVQIKDDPIKAARQFWDQESDTQIMQHMLDGDHLVLMTKERYREEVHPIIMGGRRIEFEGQKGLFLPDGKK
jgi:hypothetical protein